MPLLLLLLFGDGDGDGDGDLEEEDGTEREEEHTLSASECECDCECAEGEAPLPGSSTESNGWELDALSVVALAVLAPSAEVEDGFGGVETEKRSGVAGAECCARDGNFLGEERRFGILGREARRAEGE